jgi:hypothetical protein
MYKILENDVSLKKPTKSNRMLCMGASSSPQIGFLHPPPLPKEQLVECDSHRPVMILCHVMLTHTRNLIKIEMLHANKRMYELEYMTYEILE